MSPLPGRTVVFAVAVAVLWLAAIGLRSLVASWTNSPDAFAVGDLGTWAATAAAIALAYQGHRLNETLRKKEHDRSQRATRAAARVAVVEIQRQLTFAKIWLGACCGWLLDEPHWETAPKDVARYAPARPIPDLFMSREIHENVPKDVSAAIADLVAACAAFHVVDPMFNELEKDDPSPEFYLGNVQLLVRYLMPVYQSALHADQLVKAYLRTPWDGR